MTAIKYFRILVDQFPDNVIFLNNLAWLNLDVNPADALLYSEKAYQAFSENDDIVDTYLQALLRNNQVKIAKSLLQSKLESDPDNDNYKKLLKSLN
jgi:predicted Zn-dependent protease